MCCRRAACAHIGPTHCQLGRIAGFGAAGSASVRRAAQEQRWAAAVRHHRATIQPKNELSRRGQRCPPRRQSARYKKHPPNAQSTPSGDNKFSSKAALTPPWPHRAMWCSVRRAVGLGAHFGAVSILGHFPATCGSPMCRGVVGRLISIPPATCKLPASVMQAQSGTGTNGTYYTRPVRRPAHTIVGIGCAG